MRVHPRAVVLEERLRHERHGLAGLPRRVLDDVLVLHDVVGGREQRAEAHVDLGLAGRADLVVVHLDARCRPSRGSGPSPNAGPGSGPSAGAGSSPPCTAACSRGSARRRARVRGPSSRRPRSRRGSSSPRAGSGRSGPSRRCRTRTPAPRTRCRRCRSASGRARPSGDVARVARVHLAGDRVLARSSCMFSVVCCVNGSMYAVSGSGTRSMSDSWISWNPRIDDPSNPRPSSKLSSVSSCMGIEKCCMRPGRSQKRMSTISVPDSLARARTSFGVVILRVSPFAVERWTRLGALEGGVGPRCVNTSLRLGVVLTSGDTRTRRSGTHRNHRPQIQGSWSPTSASSPDGAGGVGAGGRVHMS